MNKRIWLNRVICMALAVLLLLVLCVAGHDCHRDECPVCLLTASFKLTLGLVACMFALSPVQQYIGFAEYDKQYVADKGSSLVTLKVKLSD